MSITLLTGDCREVLKTLPDSSIDSVVTDPPYHLTTGKKGGSGPASVNLESPYGRARIGTGFMGMVWDGGDVAHDAAMWAEVLRVLKPGGHLLSFSGSRTYHRMACAIEDAGFEIRDQIMWIYASGFPKSHNLDNRKGKDFCGCESKTECDVRPLPIGDVSPAVNVGEESRQVLQQGVPECSISASGRSELSSSQVRTREPSVEGRRDAEKGARELQGGSVRPLSGLGDANGEEGRLRDGASACDGEAVRILADADGGCRSPRSQPREQSANEPLAVSDECGPQARGAWPICPRCCKPRIPDGLGTALKPAHEPIVVARKPLIGTVAANVLAHGTGALNIDGCRIEMSAEDAETIANMGGFGRASYERQPGNALELSVNPMPCRDSTPHTAGRWPANIIHDGSEEVLAEFPNAPGQSGPSSDIQRTRGTCYGALSHGGKQYIPRNDEGSAARFFYCAKASKADREAGCHGLPTKRGGMVSNTSGQHITRRDGGDPGERANHHPTVKPTELMRYLCRLVTPPGGIVLDPFMGSGSTGRGAALEGFGFFGIELTPEYYAIAESRICDAIRLRSDAESIAEDEARQADIFGAAA